MANEMLVSITVFAALAIFALAAAVIMKIQSRKSIIGEDRDYITKYLDGKRQEIENSNSGISFPLYLGLTIGLPIALFMFLFLFMHETIGGIILAIIGFFLPELLVKYLGKRQNSLFETRYGRALKALSSDLQAGMSIQQAVEEISENHFVHKSIRTGFKQINSDIKTGLSISKAFERFAQEYKSPYTSDVAAAISMQAEVGGSEAQIIELVSANIRSRIIFKKEIKTLFADTSMLINAMDIMPFGIVAILYFMARDIIQPFFESTGMTILFVGIMLFTLIGSVFIRKKMKTAKGGDV